MNMPLVLLNRRRRGGATAPAFSPTALFALAEPGIWLDPSDLTTIFQDRAGSTLVTTPGQFVGVRLDKSKGLTLGSELVTNGTFDTDTSGWTANLTAVVTWVSGQMSVESAVNDSRNKAYQAVTCVVGRTYQLRVTCTSGTPNIRVNDSTSPTAGTVLINTGTAGVLVFAATATTQYIHVGPQGIGTAIFDNISAKELAGNHSFAPTDAARMTYGIEPKTGTRNIFTFSEQFYNAAWVKLSTTVLGNSVLAPDGTTTADTITAVAATSGHYTGQIVSPVLSATVYTVSVYARAGTNNFIQIVRDGDAQNYANFDLSSGSVGTVGTKTTAPTPVSVGGGWYRCSATFDSTSTAGTGHRFYIVDSSTASFAQSWAAAGTETVYLWGAQLERSATATAYQKVTSAFDVTEAGVASCHYCQYDGSDDSMSTAAIDFTSTDAMSVFAGVWKRTDAALGNLLELSVDAVNTAGTFAMRAPNTTASAAYSYLSRGTALAQAATPTTFPAPRYNLVSGLSDISDDQCVIRVNGVQATSSTSDQGTGNYGNHQLFIGRRNNTNLPFAGRDYGIIVVGKAVSAGDLASTETWLADKTPGVTL